jgi:hypothetical protein
MKPGFAAMALAESEGRLIWVQRVLLMLLGRAVATADLTGQSVGVDAGFLGFPSFF